MMGDVTTRTLAKEQDHHERAFEFYYGLGESRSYEKAAAEFRVALSTAKLWGRSFHWKQRIRERDMEVAREVATRTLSVEVSQRERNVQIVQMALVQLARAIADGSVKMTLGDLDKLIRLEAFLSDQPDSRQEIVFADLRNKSTEELREMVREEVEMLKELEVAGSAIENCEPETKPLDG
jgi:hypothetical protein